MEKNEERKLVISTESNGILFIYSTEVNTERLIDLQNVLIDKYGSRRKYSEKGVESFHVDNVSVGKAKLPESYQRPQKQDKIILTSKKESGYVNVFSKFNSISMPVYDIEYEVVKVPYMAQIIERILNGDLAAISSLNSNYEDKTEFDYAREIASCVKLQEVYSCEASQYLEILGFMEDSNKKRAIESVRHLKKLMIDGSKIIDRLNTLSINPFQITYENNGGVKW